MDNVRVVIRVRPLIKTEQSSNEIVHWKVQDNRIWQLDADSQKKSYTFDRIFPSTSSSSEIFDEVAQPVLDAVMEGYNGTIFAYGQTSSGKTHTMMGTDADLGVIPRVANALFEAIENMPSRRFLLRVSYMEIYNERVFDLLGIDKKQRNVREDMNGKTFVENLEEEFVHNCEDLLKIMKKGELSRSYSSTHANENSSRSHTIFTLTVESASNQEGEEDVVIVSQLNLVDLAGSERASQSRSTGDRFREGCAINTSLFTLRKVIKGLSQADGQFICFRDSRLTRILQPSLGGNAKTSIICTVTPAMIEETHSTLQFASTAKTVRNKPTVNEVLSDEALLKRYTKEIESLQKELETRNAAETKNQEFKQMEQKLQESIEQNQMLGQKLQKLTERIVTSSVNMSPILAIAKPNQNYRRLTWGGPRLCKMLSQELNKTPVQVTLSAIKSNDRRSEDATDDEEQFIPGKKVRFANRFSDECLVVTNDVECQVNLNDLATQVDSTGLDALRSQVEGLSNDNAQLAKKIAMLKIDLRSERASRILAEKRQSQNADTTFQFLKEENSVQDEEIKNLKDRIATLTKSSLESKSKLKDVNDKQATENLELRNVVVLLEQKLQDASTLFQTEHIQSQKELQNLLDLAQKKIEKLNVELKDSQIQYEHNHKHADVVKNELRQQLQAAYNRIDYLEQHNAQLDVSKFEVCARGCGDKSVHELTLGPKDFSKLFNKLPATPSEQGTCGIDYDSEMQIVQMEFELREATHLERIAAQDSRIEELTKNAKQHAETLQEVDDLKATIKKAQEKEKLLVVELEKARLNCRDPVLELDVKNWEARQCKMLKKIADLEEEISNYKSTTNIIIPEAPVDYLDMHDKIDALLRIVQEFGQKEQSYIAELPLGEDLNFRKHLKDSQECQEELQSKVEDLRRLIVQFKQKEQHVLGELEVLKTELQNRQSLGNDDAITQSEKMTEMSDLIQKMKQKEKHLVEKLENLEDHIRQEGTNSMKDVEGELIEMRKKTERLEADILEYKQREEAISAKSLSSNLIVPQQQNASTETDVTFQTALDPSEAEKHELDHLRIKLAESEAMMSNYKERETSIKQEVEKLREELRQETASMRVLQDKIEEFERFKAAHHVKLQEFESIKIDYRNKLEELETCKTDCAKNLDEFEGLKSKHQNVLEEFEQFKAENRNKLAEFNSSTDDLKLQLASAKTTASDAELKAREADAKQAELELKLQEFEREVIDKKQEEDQMSASVKDLQDDLKRHQGRAEEEALRITQAEQKLSTMNKKNEEMSEAIAEYVRNETAYLEELRVLRLEHELHRECENRITALQIEKAECIQREKQLRQYTQTLESEAKSVSNGNFRELLGELNSIRERELCLRNALKEKDVKLKDAQQQVHRGEENVDSLQQQLYELKNEHDVLQTHLLEMDEQESKVEAERKLLAKLQAETAEKEREMLHAVKMAEIRASDLQTECDVMKKKQHILLCLERDRSASSSVGVQCRLVKNPPAVKTAWTQVEGSLLGHENSEVCTQANNRTQNTETAPSSSVNCGTQCNLIEQSSLLQNGVKSKQNLWTFTSTRGVQCELLSNTIYQQKDNQDDSTPLGQTMDTTLGASIKENQQISDKELAQMKAKLEMYERENANLAHDIMTVRGTLHEHSESKRTMQNKLFSLEKNLEYMTEKCDQLKAEIRRLNSMKNMSIFGDALPQKRSEDDDNGSNSKLLHSGTGLITRDNMEEIQIKHEQLQTKYERLKKLFLKQTSSIQRSKKQVDKSSPKLRMPSTAHLSPAVRISKISSRLVPQDVTENKSPANIKHSSDRRGNMTPKVQVAKTSSNLTPQDVIENKPPENMKPYGGQHGNVGLSTSGNLTSTVQVTKISSNPILRGVIESKTTEMKPFSEQLGNVGVPFSGIRTKQESMTFKKEPEISSRSAEIKRYLSGRNAVFRSEEMHEEDDNCKVS